MAKTYLSTIKYMIHADFEIDGIVDKPDIIGAIFGQSEGLLGDDMDLKELQKAGKVGRIEIKPKSYLGKTKGILEVPSSMDKAQTALLGAAIESVDKVGPCDASFQIIKIEDERKVKRKEVSSRAKELLQQLTDSVPETMEMAEGLREEVRKADISSYGRDKLPAGPDIKDSEEVIVVEGRADVLNLLRNNIKNVVGMDGNKIPNTVVSLSKRKSLTLFVDGDRGGDLVARKLQEVAKVDYLAKAPDGKEVEELTGKEIHLALRRRISPNEDKPRRSYARAPAREKSYSSPQRTERGSYGRDRGSSYGRGSQGSYGRGRSQSYGRGRSSSYGRGSSGAYGGGRSSSYGRSSSQGRGRGYSRSSQRDSGRGYSRSPGRGRGSFSRDRGSYGRTGGGRNSYSSGYRRGNLDSSQTVQQREIIPTKEEESNFGPLMKQLTGTMKAKLLDSSNKELAEINVREIVGTLKDYPDVHAIVFDGIITKRLIEAAEKHSIEYLVGIKKAKIDGKHAVRALTLSA